MRACVVVERPAREAGHERPHGAHVVVQGIVERVVAGEHEGTPVCDEAVRGEGVEVLAGVLLVEQVERQRDGWPDGDGGVRPAAL